ncbi:MAG: lytic transglycosylase domain-containing protein [Clostridia bacterium]|nr:lytic transglycosylase domain-containing protein [Clostridia bacterium]
MRFVLLTVVVILGIVALKSCIDTINRMRYPLRHVEYIDKYSKEYGLDRYLVMGVIKAESNYIHDAHSGVARGLMQITDDTAKWIAGKMGLEFKADDIEDPETNIKMGCFYLSYLIAYYKNIDVALAAYNGGMGNVDKWLANKKYSADGKTLFKIPFAETEKYVERVNKYMKIYKKIYGSSDRASFFALE